MKRLRKRGLSYTLQEKCALLTIMKKYKSSVIDDKRTNSIAAARKRRTWSAITDEFNKQTSSERARDPKQLKHLFLNMRARFKLNCEPEQHFPDEKLFAKFCNKAMHELLSGSNTNSAEGNRGQENEMDDNCDLIVNMHPSDVVLANLAEEQQTERVNIEGGQHEFESNQETSMKEEESLNDSEDPLSDDDAVSEMSSDSEEGESLDGSQTNVSKGKVYSRESLNIQKLKEVYFKTKIGTARLQRTYMIRKSDLELKILQEKLLQLKKNTYGPNNTTNTAETV